MELPPHEDPPLPPIFAWKHVEEQDERRLEEFLAEHYSDSSLTMGDLTVRLRLQFHYSAGFLQFLFAPSPYWSRLLFTSSGEWLGHFAGYPLSMDPPTMMLSFLAVANHRRHLKAAKRLIRHLCADARANDYPYVSWSFTVGKGSSEPHPLEFSVGSDLSVPGRVEHMYQVRLWYVQLSNRLYKYELSPESVPEQPPSEIRSVSDIPGVAKKLYERKLPVGALCQKWDSPESAEAWLRRIQGGAGVGIDLLLYGDILAVIFPGPSDIYAGDSRVEIATGDQLRAAYLMYLEPLSDQISTKQRRLFARELMRKTAELGYDVMFMPELGVLAGTLPDAACYPVTNVVDQRYYWMRIGEPTPPSDGFRRDPSDLHILSV